MKNQNIKSKKAQVLSEALILLVAIATFTYALYAAYLFNTNYSTKLSVPTELVQAYENQEGFDIYAKDAARLSLGEALSNVLKSNPTCKIIANENIPIWSSECVSKSKFDEAFQKEIDSQFRKLLNSNRKYNIVLGDKIQFEFEPITMNISEEGYSGTYQYQTIFSIENPVKEDAGMIYQKVLARMDDCRNSSAYDLCVNKMVLNDYTVNCSSGKYLICSIKTKQDYFFNDSFGKIESKFAMNI